MPIEKTKKSLKNVKDDMESNEVDNERESRRNFRKNEEEFENNAWIISWVSSSKILTFWIVLIRIVLIVFMIYTYNKFDSLTRSDDIQLLQKKVSSFESKWDWEVYVVNYEWWSSVTNNLRWIWEKSLWFPDYLKWKNCYILWSKISWDDWGTIRWYLWKNGNWSSYETSANYEARINNYEEKIEITKWNWSSSMLTKKERDNLYFSLTLLCR